jgi:hypothetical protein
VGLVECMREKKKFVRGLVGKREGKSQLGRRRRRRLDKIKTDLTLMEWQS